MVDDTVFHAVWCKDSETCEEFLIELKTGKKLLRKSKLGFVEVYDDAL